MFFFDPLWLILIGPAVIFAIWAQFRTQAAFAKFSKITTRGGLTGAEVAKRLLDTDRLNHVAVERVPGQLTDHYDPRSQVLRLSQSVHDSPSIAAVGVAAHEAGHAFQHAIGYTPLTFRQAFYPVAAFASRAWVWLFLIGMFMASAPMGQTLMFAAAGCMGAYALFAVVTLPVEFDASKRALFALETSGSLTAEELIGARKVLNAAALTYVASAAQAILTVIYLLMRARR